MNIVDLLKSKDDMLRTRTCMLFRLLVRFSLRGFQNIWNIEIKQAMELLADDECDEIREVRK